MLGITSESTAPIGLLCLKSTREEKPVRTSEHFKILSQRGISRRKILRSVVGYLRSILYTNKAFRLRANYAMQTPLKQNRLVSVYRTPWPSSIPSSDYLSTMHNLCVEDKGGTDLVGGLIELLGIKGGSETESDTRAEKDVVGNSGDTTVVDLDLFLCISKALVRNPIDVYLPWRMRQGPIGTCWQPQDRLGFRSWSPR